MGYVMAISAATIDPSRVGGNLESAHVILAGLAPVHKIGFALAMGKLMMVRLNDMWVHSPPLGAQANFNRIEKRDTM